MPIYIDSKKKKMGFLEKKKLRKIVKRLNVSTKIQI